MWNMIFWVELNFSITRAHVDSKRYLAIAEDGYYDLLSEEIGRASCRERV